MSAFDAAGARMIDRVYATMGDGATYTPRSGAPVPCTVLVETDLSQYGQAAAVNVATAVISVRVSEVADAPRRGDTFAMTIGGKVYKVDSLQGTDALEHKVFVA